MLREGSLEILAKQQDGVLAYKRKLNNEEVLVILNFGKKPKEVKVPEGMHPAYQIYEADKVEKETAYLSGFGAMILYK